MRNPCALRPASRSRALCAVLAVMMLITGFPLSGAAARQSDGDLPIDLAAMVLRPSDFEAEGIDMMGETRYERAVGAWNYLTTGSVTLPEAIEHSAVAEAPDPLAADLYLDLAETGWQQQFRSLLSSHEQDSALFISTVGEYADADGAAAAFHLLTSIDGVPGVRELDDGGGIGDESAAHRDRSSLIRVDGDRTTLMFRLDNLIGAIQVYELDPVEPELLTALAERMIERIKTVHDGDPGGLSHLALRLTSQVSPMIERYDLLDADFLPFWDETEDEREERAAAWETRVNVFRVDQPIPLDGLAFQDVPRYSINVIQFEDDTAAEDYLADYPGQRDDDPLDDVETFGDESLTYLESYEWLGVDRVGFRILTRVGEFAMHMVLDAYDTSPELGTLEALMTRQLACFDAGSCLETEPIPTELLDLTCGSGPVDEADEPLGYDIDREMTMAGGDPAQTGAQPGPGPDGDPELIWRFEANGNIDVAPVVADGLVLFGGGDGDEGGEDGNFYALDAATGERRWCLPTGGVIFGTAGFADGLVIAALNDSRVQAGNGGVVTALYPDTGEEHWRVFVPGKPLDILTDEQSVYVRVSGMMIALDLETGETLWRFGPGTSDDPSIFGAALADDVIYVHFSDGMNEPRRIYAIDASTGEEIWVFEELHEEQYFAGGPVVADGLVFVGASDGSLYVLDAVNGDEEFRFAPEIEAWEEIEDGGMTFNTPAVVDGVIYAGTGSWNDEVEGDGYLFAIDAESGDELWRYETGDPVDMQPAIADGVAYFGDITGLLHAVDTDTGEQSWTFELDGTLGPDTPAIVDGVLYITDLEGSLYAIAGEDR